VRDKTSPSQRWPISPSLHHLLLHPEQLQIQATSPKLQLEEDGVEERLPEAEDLVLVLELASPTM